MDLIGIEWRLTYLRGQEPLGEAKISLQVENRDPLQIFGGQGGCNGYGATNLADKVGEVEINAVESTAIGCPGSTGRQEKLYFHALRDAAAYRIRDGLLEIRNVEGKKILAFDRKLSLPVTGGG